MLYANIEDVRNSVRGILGKDLPIGVDEWNFDPSGPPPAYGSTDEFLSQFVPLVMSQLVKANVAYACQFDAASFAGYGGLDILHNNAAATRLAATEDRPVSAADPAVWDMTMRVNLRGALVAIQAAVPHMIARGGGSVINTASGSALAGDLHNPAYGASKAALITLTTYVAAEFGKQGIRCNAISPGFILIPEKPGRDAVAATMLRHTLMPRVGVPDDIAALVVFLASDESAFITGQNISVDGGMRAHQPYLADFRGN